MISVVSLGYRGPCAVALHIAHWINILSTEPLGQTLASHVQKLTFVLITILRMQDLEVSGKNKQLSRVRDEEVSDASNQRPVGELTPQWRKMKR